MSSLQSLSRPHPILDYSGFFFLSQTFVRPHWPCFDQETVGFLLSSIDFALRICGFWPGEGINLFVSPTDRLVDC